MNDEINYKNNPQRDFMNERSRRLVKLAEDEGFLTTTISWWYQDPRLVMCRRDRYHIETDFGTQWYILWLSTKMQHSQHIYLEVWTTSDEERLLIMAMPIARLLLKPIGQGPSHRITAKMADAAVTALKVDPVEERNIREETEGINAVDQDFDSDSGMDGNG